MTFVSVTTICARRPGVLAGAIAALVSAAALAPCVSAVAGTSHHRSHAGSGGRGSAAPAAAGPRNLLTSGDGTLDTAVGVYGDCSGATPVPTDMAAVDTCIRGRTYFVGHNLGVFTPLMHMGVGSILTWYDARGAVHRYRVVGVRDTPGNGAHPLITTTRRVVAQFQTCAVTNGSVDRILDAVAA